MQEFVHPTYHSILAVERLLSEVWFLSQAWLPHMGHGLGKTKCQTGLGCHTVVDILDFADNK